ACEADQEGARRRPRPLRHADPLLQGPFVVANFLVWVVWLGAAFGCLVSALAVVSFRNPFYSALALIGNLASLAVLFLLLSGAFGLMLRRSPLIILLSVEIMLNSANLLLIAFSRLHGREDGQIFAISVMAVAASEVVVGLGMIVAMGRRNVDLDVDKLRTLRG